MDGLKTARTGAKGASEELVPAPVLAREFNVTRRTLGNWFVNPKLHFPKPTEINGRLYFPRSAIETWKLNHARASLLKRKGAMTRTGSGLEDAAASSRAQGISICVAAIGLRKICALPPKSKHHLPPSRRR